MGSGGSSVWYDDWSGIGKVAEIIPSVHISDTVLCLCDLVEQGGWRLDRLSTMIPSEVANLFLTVEPRLAPSSRDAWTWKKLQH